MAPAPLCVPRHSQESPRKWEIRYGLFCLLLQVVASDSVPKPASAKATPSGAAQASASTNATDYRLTKDRILAHTDANNVILVTFVNAQRADYAYTWAWHVRRLGLKNYMIGALDGIAPCSEEGGSSVQSWGAAASG